MFVFVVGFIVGSFLHENGFVGPFGCQVTSVVNNRFESLFYNSLLFVCHCRVPLLGGYGTSSEWW